MLLFVWIPGIIYATLMRAMGGQGGSFQVARLEGIFFWESSINLGFGDNPMSFFHLIVGTMYAIEALAILFAIGNMDADVPRATMFFAMAIYLHVSRPVLLRLSDLFKP